MWDPSGQRSWILVAWLFVLALCAGPSEAQEPDKTHPTMRVAVVGGTAGETIDNITSWTLDVPRPIPDFVEVELEIRMVSRVEACVVDPELCVPSAESTTFTPDPNSPDSLIRACGDGIDNDEDGLVDIDDPECLRVSGWSFAIATDTSFAFQDTSFDGTVADLDTNPPGRADSQCSFGRLARPVDPEVNNGQGGVVGFVVLSNCDLRKLDAQADDVFLRVFGRIDVGALARGAPESEPVFVRVVEILSTGPDSESRSRVSLGGQHIVVPGLVGAAIKLRGSKETLFRRGDANGDRQLTIVDGQFLLNFLFLGGPSPTCGDAADSDDSGSLDLNDGVSLFNVLFLGTGTIAAPGPALCGTDPTADELTCTAFATCP